MIFTQDPNILPQPGSRQGVLICLQIFFTTIALFVYGLRIYTRRFILRSLGNDDYIMGGAVVSLRLIPFGHWLRTSDKSIFTLLLTLHPHSLRPCHPLLTSTYPLYRLHNLTEFQFTLATHQSTLKLKLTAFSLQA